MNKTIPFSIAICIAAFNLVADPVADLVTAGRDSLATNHTTAGLQTAYADFTSAVNISPNNPTANALAAATRLLLLPQSPGGAAFLTGLGVSTTGRDIYNWTADFQRDANGNVVLPANLNTSADIAAYTGSVLPAINASLVNLAAITDTNFILNLTANETDSQDVTLDYGDIQLLRAFLYLADNFGHFLGAYNFSVVINHLRDLGQSDQLSFQRILSDYPSLFTLTSGAEVRASKIGLTNAIYRYFSASDFIRNSRTNGADRLFNLQTNDVDREATFRSNVAIFQQSLDHPVDFDLDGDHQFYAGAYFAGNTSIRSLVPKFNGDRYVYNSMPDYTFGGILLGVPACTVESLARQASPSFAGVYSGQLFYYDYITGDTISNGFFSFFVSTNLQATLIASDSALSTGPGSSDGVLAQFTLQNKIKNNISWELHTNNIDAYGTFEHDGSVDGNWGFFDTNSASFVGGNFLGNRAPDTGALQNGAGLYSGSYSGGGKTGLLKATLAASGQFIFVSVHQDGSVQDANTTQLDSLGHFSYTTGDGTTIVGGLSGTTISGTFSGANGSGTFSMTRSAFVRPDVSPSITTSPLNQNATAGQTVTFHVGASGSAPLCYQWSSNDVPILGAMSASLVLSNVQLSSAATYSVVVMNLVGTNSVSAALAVVPETIRPMLAITSPTAGQRVSNAVFTVTGTASDNASVSNVWYQINNGGWLLANGSTSWSADVGLTPGPNLVQAFAVDTSGNFSLTNNRSFSYVLSAPLVVTKVGNGTITPNYNGQLLEIGKAYTLTAAPGVGFGFARWTGSMSSSNRALTFQMQSNLMLTANFVDVMRPTLTISAPTLGQRWSNAVFTVKGMARDNGAVAGVYYQINGGDWSLADGTTNWSAVISLTPGTNKVSAYALDGADNSSTTNSRILTYVVSDVLQLSENGLGGFTPNYSNAFLEINKSYKITAKPGNGYVFSNWTGGVFADPGTVFATTNPLSFLMQSNLSLNANFVPNPFLPRKGSYNGLFGDLSQTNRDQNSSGFFTLMLTDRGTYSASLKSGNKQWPATGSFDVGGNSTLPVKRPGTNSLTVALSLDLTSTIGLITGTASDGIWQANLFADRAEFDVRTNPATQFAHKYTLIIPGGDLDGITVGDGYGTLTVSTSGQLIFTGNLADGTPISQVVPVSQAGYWPFYQSLYGGLGSIWEWMKFDTNIPPDDLHDSGGISWIKPAQQTARYYPSGFNGFFYADGSIYTSPLTATNPVIALSDAVVTFQDGNLSAPFTNNVFVTPSSKIVNTSSNKLTMTVVLPSGKFTGNVTPPGMNNSIPIQGAVFQNTATAYGYFLGTNASGSVELTAPPGP